MQHFDKRCGLWQIAVVTVRNTCFNACAGTVTSVNSLNTNKCIWKSMSYQYLTYNFNKGHWYLMAILWTKNEGKTWGSIFKIKPTFHQMKNSTFSKMSWCSDKFNILISYYGGFKRKEHLHSNTTIFFINIVTWLG